jgi:predicted permease
MITPGYFEVFGTVPSLGQVFTENDLGVDNLLVIMSHGFWSRRFGDDSTVIGKTLRLDQTAFTIVGVLPAGFAPITGAPDVYIPHSVGTERWIGRWLAVYGRMSPGMDLADTGADLNSIMNGIGEREERSAGYQVRLTPLKTDIVGGVETTLLMLAAAVALVLLIASANVANLALVRAVGLARDVSVRLALGAGRQHIARQALIESLVLALLGGIAGVGLAAVLLPAMIALAPPSVPRLDAVALDPAVLGFTLVVSMVVGILFGMAPLAYTWRTASADDLHRGSHRHHLGGRRVLGGLVVGEIALAFMVLIMAGLLLKSFEALRGTDPGFGSRQTVALQIALPHESYPTEQHRSVFFQRLVEEVAALPGVSAAAIGSNMPLSGRGSWLRARSESGLRAGRDEWPPALQRVAGEGFFEALGIAVVEGRGFERSDRETEHSLAVINQALARQLWPGESAVGQRLTFRREPSDSDWVEVIGVAADVKYQELGAVPEPQVYEFHDQHAWGDMYLFVNGQQSDAATINSVRAVLTRSDSEVPIAESTTLDAVVGAAVAGPRFTLLLFGAFAMVALTLAAAGVYGVLSFAVSQRRRELGIMMALGAERQRVVGMVLRRGLALLAGGVVVGLSGALVGVRLLESILYQVRPTDLGTFAGVAAVLALSVAAACLAPSLRASRVNPVDVLREE